MSYAPMEDVIRESQSIYKIVIIASRRAQEISQGSPVLVEVGKEKPSTIALKEIAAGKVSFKLKAEGGKKKSAASGKAK
ncbi:MAG: DNA-directed RNA polymerase subunit omega [Candidatus Omnitrophica bacterium]|nr:DNA-directed RNA polymerase subunit omega [Candidatus Omnitrophota bacterium]